jgi:hypothetical protein
MRARSVWVDAERVGGPLFAFDPATRGREGLFDGGPT